MSSFARFSSSVTPDWQALLACIKRQGTPSRVHAIELFLDPEIKMALSERFNLAEGLDPTDPWFFWQREIRLQRFLGYDYVRCGVEGIPIAMHRQSADGRSFVDEHTGPIASWDDFHRYPWPAVEAMTTQALDWLGEQLPDDMCIIGSGGFGHFYEWLSFLMGYETLCFALFEQRDLVQAVADRTLAINLEMARRLLACERVRALWGADDMGYRTGTLVSPADLRAFVLPGHRQLAAMAHAAGRPYLLHSCGNLTAIMDDLIDDVRIDGKHSFEDVIGTVEEARTRYGDRIALLGGVDVDFLCRADEQQVRERVRRTLQNCMPGGGYVLGTGNSVANYIPMDNYLAMLDEGRRFI
jgi:uroporphyrinogen decarboxylase